MLCCSAVTVTALGGGAGASAQIKSFSGAWRGFQRPGDTGPHLCQRCDPRARVLPIPGLILPGQGPAGAPGQLRGSGPGTAAPSLGSESLRWAHRAAGLAPAVPRGRFTGCQSRGQRSAGVRKSISVRSLSTSFNLMKPLFVKAAALPALPLKPSRAQPRALKGQEGVPVPSLPRLPFSSAQNKHSAHGNVTLRLWAGTRHRERGGSAPIGDVAASPGCKVTEDGQKSGGAEEIAAACK